jgi:hypothetical protein
MRDFSMQRRKLKKPHSMGSGWQNKPDAASRRLGAAAISGARIGHMTNDISMYEMGVDGQTKA